MTDKIFKVECNKCEGTWKVRESVYQIRLSKMNTADAIYLNDHYTCRNCRRSHSLTMLGGNNKKKETKVA